jgi:hypothetical protein
MLERFLGAKKEKWTQEHRSQLLGVWNATEEGEASISELFQHDHDDFDDVQSPVVPPATGNGGTKATAAHFMQPKGEATERPTRTPAKETAGPTPPPVSDEDKSVLRRRLRQHASLLELTDENIQFDKLIEDALAIAGSDQQKLLYITDVANGKFTEVDYSVPLTLESPKQSKADTEESPDADVSDAQISDYVWEVNDRIQKSQRIGEIEQLYDAAKEGGLNTVEDELLTSTKDSRIQTIKSWNRGAKKK